MTKLKSWPLPTLVNMKKNHLTQSHWLLCILKNCDWSRKFMPLSNLTLNSLLVE